MPGSLRNPVAQAKGYYFICFPSLRVCRDSIQVFYPLLSPPSSLIPCISWGGGGHVNEIIIIKELGYSYRGDNDAVSKGCGS